MPEHGDIYIYGFQFIPKVRPLVGAGGWAWAGWCRTSWVHRPAAASTSFARPAPPFADDSTGASPPRAALGAWASRPSLAAWPRFGRLVVGQLLRSALGPRSAPHGGINDSARRGSLIRLRG